MTNVATLLAASGVVTEGLPVSLDPPNLKQLPCAAFPRLLSACMARCRTPEEAPGASNTYP